MQDDRNEQGHARIRHVPIRIEKRDNQPESKQQHYNQQQQPQRHHHHYHHPNDQRDDLSNQRYQQQQGQRNNNHQHEGHNHNHQNSYTSQTLPNTSSIDINYKPSPPQRPYRSPSPNPPGFRSDQDNNYLEIFSRLIGSNAEGLLNKRSEDPVEARNIKKEQSADPLADEDSQPADPPETIPLPPPPAPSSHHQDAKDNDQNQPRASSAASQADESKQNSGDSNRQPDESDATSAINAIRAEVIKLLNDINTFTGTSLKAKEYLKLDELLTRCILRLDDIQCGGQTELRQQRKAVIELIDKCTDVLQRKVQLNDDMQQLFSRCSQ